MKNFHVITLFPEAFQSYCASSILARAQKNGRIRIHFVNPRDFTSDAHKTADDRPFGGGPGMVLKAEPIVKAAEAVLRKAKKAKIVLLSPSGTPFTQKCAQTWSRRYSDIILISGRYEGIDARVTKILKAEEISIGPYILTGGELPAMVIMDAVARHLPDVLGKRESLEEKHGSYPVYTRPETIVWKKKKYPVPSVLMSGNHEKIYKWRKKYLHDAQ